MNYKVGDKVKCDGGDWLFFGTVSAVFEHSICPCYRLNVERMEKKNCKFSITQFEFELEPYEVESGIDKRKWENPEIEDFEKSGILNNEDLSKTVKMRPQIVGKKRRMIKQKPKQEAEQEPKTKQKQELKQETGPETVKLTQKQEKKERIRKTTDAWDNNFELYRNGEKSNVLNAWKSKNRKDYKAGILSNDKLEKLIEINFPFDELIFKKSNSWDRQLEAWKKGDRKSPKIQLWKQRSIRRFVEGKLAGDRILKLKEVGILK